MTEEVKKVEETTEKIENGSEVVETTEEVKEEINPEIVNLKKQIQGLEKKLNKETEVTTPEKTSGINLGGDESQVYTSRAFIREKGWSEDSDEVKTLSNYLALDGINNLEEAYSNKGAQDGLANLKARKDAESFVVERDDEKLEIHKRDTYNRFENGDNPKSEEDVENIRKQHFPE